jgi:hypothetical protein
MYGAHTQTDLQRPPEGNDVYTRLNWLVAVNAQSEYRRGLFRYQGEEEELLLMRRPFDLRRAFALFGLMLGLFPPAAIFIKMFSYGLVGHDAKPLLFIICLLMNFTCAGVGYVMGGALSHAVESALRARWSVMVMLLALVGAGWGAVTGFAGGLIFVGLGAIFGAAFAVPIGSLAFTLFGSLHRLVARGGMIDARHFWPLATGATLFAAALVLGLGK